MGMLYTFEILKSKYCNLCYLIPDHFLLILKSNNLMMKKLFPAALLVASIFSVFSSNAQNKKPVNGYYQITVYNFKTSDQQSLIDNYLQTAYLPALHHLKIKNVGVFAPITNDTSINKKLYVIIPLPSFEAAATLTKKITSYPTYVSNGKAYLDVAHTNAAYTRIENILLEKFAMAPFFILPKLTGNRDERIFELRSYESASEKIYQNKVYMFNEGKEIDIFKKLNFNAVFYATVIAGSRMPNLMYMTSFENIADRDEHWKKFSASDDWKKLSGLPMYQNNVSKADIILMKSTPYSDY